MSKSNGEIGRRAALRALLAASGIAMIPGRLSAQAQRPLVALVHTQSAGDDGITDDMIASLKGLAINAGFTARVIYASDPTTYEPILRLLGEAGAAVVLGTFEAMGRPIRAVAPSFPRTRFVHIYGDRMNPPIPNVRTVEYDAYIVAFLVGVFAAFLSRTGKIGFVGGSDLPSINAAANALIIGAHSVNKDLVIEPSFVGSFQDPAKAFVIGEQLYRSGSDFIHLASAGSDIGVIQAANAHRGRLISGESAKHFALAPTSMTSILLLDFGKSVQHETTLALRSSWQGGHVHSGLSDGVLNFVLSPVFAANGPRESVAAVHKALPYVARARQRLVDGSIRVPLLTRLA